MDLPLLFANRVFPPSQSSGGSFNTVTMNKGGVGGGVGINHRLIRNSIPITKSPNKFSNGLSTISQESIDMTYNQNQSQQLETLKLKQQIKELEKENFKLTHHVTQAEQSIKSYRGLLTNKPNNSNSNSNNNNSIINSTDKIHEENEIKIRILLKEIAGYKTKLSSLTSTHQIELKEKEDEMLNEIKKFKENISELEKKLESKKISKDENKINPEMKSLLIQQCNQLFYQNQLMRSEIKKMNNEIQEYFAKEMKDWQRKFIETFQHQQKVSRGEREGRLDEKKVQDGIIHQLQGEVRNLLNQKQQIPTIESIGTLPSKASLVPRSSDDDQGRLPSIGKSDQSTPSPIKSIGPTVAMRTDSTRSVQEESLKIVQEFKDNWKSQLKVAQEELDKVQEVHRAEIKSIKHVSHVKELLRVAKEREAEIENDRIKLEINHLREIQNILGFSLNAAEQSLKESQPHVVVKLIEGRTKRIHSLEEMKQNKLQDIDYRSMQTCAVSTNQLEMFQKKAVENHLLAESMTISAVNQLMKTLSKMRADGSTAG